MSKISVILSQCAHWRENPYSKWGNRIATPVYGLVRNDRSAFGNSPFAIFDEAHKANTAVVLPYWPYLVYLGDQAIISS